MNSEPMSNEPISNEKGSSDESIGRPAEWREGRYQQPGKPIDESVRTPADEVDRSDQPVSTPVTRRDYEQVKTSPAPRATPADCSLSRWNVGSGAAYAVR
jgi:hypothetical protein